MMPVFHWSWPVRKRAWVMAQTLDALRESFGGAAAYLRAAGVRPEQLDAIRSKLTA